MKEIICPLLTTNTVEDKQKCAVALTGTGGKK